MNALLIISSLSHPLLVMNYFNSEGHSGKKQFHSVAIHPTGGTWFVLGGCLQCPEQMLCRAEGGGPAAVWSPPNAFMFFARQLCHSSV